VCVSVVDEERQIIMHPSIPIIRAAINKSLASALSSSQDTETRFLCHPSSKQSRTEF
jgi:hypothetical protein